MDSLDQQQLQLALSLAEIIQKIDLVEAASILASFDWNINKALATIDLQTSVLENRDSSINKQQPEKIEQKVQKNKEIKALQQQKQGKIQYKQPISAILKGSEQKVLQYSPQKWRQLRDNNFFLSYIKQKYNPLLNFSLLNFSQSLLKSFNESRHLLIYIHYLIKDIERSNNEFIRKILSNPISSKFVNKHCIVFGTTNQSEILSKLQKYFKGFDVPFLALFKYNYTSKTEEFLSTYSPQDMDNGFQFLEWVSCSMQIELTKTQVIEFEKSLSKTKKSFIGQEEKKVAEESKQKKKKIEEIKLKEDIKQLGKQNKREGFPKFSKVIKQQNMADQKNEQSQIFYDIDKFPSSKLHSNIQDSSLIDDKSLINHGQSQNIRWEQDRLYSRLQKSYLKKREMSEMEKTGEKIKEQNLNKKKIKYQTIFDNISTEPFVNIKFRLPSGENKQQKFNKRQKIQNIFLFADCHFRQSFQYKFSEFKLDIPFSDKDLNNQKDKLIEQLSEEGQRIIIILKEI